MAHLYPQDILRLHCQMARLGRGWPCSGPVQILQQPYSGRWDHVALHVRAVDVTGFHASKHAHGALRL